jgi:hypothetical protein
MDRAATLGIELVTQFLVMEPDRLDSGEFLADLGREASSQRLAVDGLR